MNASTWPTPTAPGPPRRPRAVPAGRSVSASGSTTIRKTPLRRRPGEPPARTSGPGLPTPHRGDSARRRGPERTRAAHKVGSGAARSEGEALGDGTDDLCGNAAFLARGAPGARPNARSQRRACLGLGVPGTRAVAAPCRRGTALRPSPCGSDLPGGRAGPPHGTPCAPPFGTRRRLGQHGRAGARRNRRCTVISSPPTAGARDHRGDPGGTHRLLGEVLARPRRPRRGRRAETAAGHLRLPPVGGRGRRALRPAAQAGERWGLRPHRRLRRQCHRRAHRGALLLRRALPGHGPSGRPPRPRRPASVSRGEPGLRPITSCCSIASSMRWSTDTSPFWRASTTRSTRSRTRSSGGPPGSSSAGSST